MDYKTAVLRMRKYFRDNYTTTPIILPDSADDTTSRTGAWVRFNILHTDGFQASMGSPANNRFERNGIITIQIFTPQGNNTVTATDIADEILKLYEGVKNNDIIYSDAYAKEVGNDGRGWYQINILTNFKYEEIT